MLWDTTHTTHTLHTLHTQHTHHTPHTHTHTHTHTTHGVYLHPQEQLRRAVPQGDHHGGVVEEGGAILTS